MIVTYTLILLLTCDLKVIYVKMFLVGERNCAGIPTIFCIIPIKVPRIKRISKTRITIEIRRVGACHL